MDQHFYQQKRKIVKHHHPTRAEQDDSSCSTPQQLQMGDEESVDGPRGYRQKQSEAIGSR